MTRWSASVIKVGAVDVDIHVSSHLKQELAWTTDKQLQVINMIMFRKNSYSTKELKNKTFLNLNQHCLHCYVDLKRFLIILR